MKKPKSWDDYEKELFKKGKITEKEMIAEKLKIGNKLSIEDAELYGKILKENLNGV